MPFEAVSLVLTSFLLKIFIGSRVIFMTLVQKIKK
jgi:hypothetical protein